MFYKKGGKILAQKAKGIKEQHITPLVNSYQQKTVTHFSKPCAPFTNYCKNLCISDMLSSVVTTNTWKQQVCQRHETGKEIID